MPRGIPKVPTPLDRFLDVDFLCLQKVMNTGRIDIAFSTDNQAINTKSRLWRLKNSIMYYKPNEPLAEACKTFVFKRQGSRLTIIRREMSAEYDAQMAALGTDVPDPSAIADAQEGKIVQGTRDFERELLSGESQDDEANPS